jgi:hypothetical protein
VQDASLPLWVDQQAVDNAVQPCNREWGGTYRYAWEMRIVDRPELADFLRRRRQALQPEDVGLFRGPRRRTSGLRR